MASVSEQRRYICSALVNSQTDEEMYDYLFSALDTMTPPLDPSTYNGTVLVDDINLFSFVKDMYPSVTLKKIDKPAPKQLTQLYLTNVVENDHDLLTFSFSFYSNHRKAQFEIGLDRDGVLLTKDDAKDDAKDDNESKNSFNTLYPYFLLLSDKPKSIQYFLEMIKGLVDKMQLKNIDVFLPESFYGIIPFIDFDKVIGTFPSIMLYKKDGSANSITYSEIGNTLRIKPITSMVTNEMVKKSLDHILIDYNENKNEKETELIRQSIIDTISKFHEKVLWSGDTSDFHKTLSRYTNHGKIGKKVTFSFGNKKQTLKKLIGYQWKKPFPLFKEKSKEEMDTLIRLAMMAPNCKDILEIITDKRTNVRGKIKKFLQLNIL
jgi:hypothetical protein